MGLLAPDQTASSATPSRAAGQNLRREQIGGTGFAMDVTKNDSGEAVIRLAGELDAATAPRLRTALFELADGTARTVRVDLARLNFINSTGLVALTSGLKRLRRDGGDLTLRSPNRRALRLFEITGLNRVFAIN